MELLLDTFPTHFPRSLGPARRTDGYIYGMIEQAQSSTPQEDYPNLTFRKSPEESLTFLENESFDLLVAGQAAHWFDTAKLFPEMGRELRKRGNLDSGDTKITSL